MNILDELVAKGVAGEVIVAVAKLIAEVDHLKENTGVLDRQRAAARERMRGVRERSRTVQNSSEQTVSFLKKDSLKEVKKEPRSKKLKTILPDDWQPKGPQRDPAEPDEFRNKARANGWTYADWHAAYFNYQKHPEYNWRNKNGGPAAPMLDEAERIAMLAEFHRVQLNGRNVNGQGNGKDTEAAKKPRSDHTAKL